MKTNAVTYSSHSEAETEQIGSALARRLIDENKRSAFVALYGDLGAGKTAFVRGFVSQICTARVKSPTYTVVNEYRGGIVPVFHFDMYRIDGEDDLYSTGFYDYIDTGYLLCEWSENIGFAMPKVRTEVRIEKNGNGAERRITIEEKA